MKRFSRIVALSFAIPTLALMCLALTGASRSEAAASGLTLAESCAADGTASLYFGWQGSNPAAKELWLDVISLAEGGQQAALVSAGPLSPDTRSYDNWQGFAAGRTYSIRLNQLMWDGTWDPSKTVSFTTFVCSGPGASGSGATGVSLPKSSISATGYAAAPGSSKSATGYASTTGSTAGSDFATIRPVPPPTNTLTYNMAPSTTGAGASALGPFIPYAGNGGGPTPCADGMTSNSSGPGTCSGHGGVLQ